MRSQKILANDARRRFDELKGNSGQISGSVQTDRILGMLADATSNYESAEDYFNKALKFCRSADYRPELARSCSNYSLMLLSRGEPGDLEKATELQDEAIAIATELGMQPLLERVLAQREILKA
jgi:tetratricopeptide (TPR) repeat protein